MLERITVITHKRISFGYIKIKPHVAPAVFRTVAVENKLFQFKYFVYGNKLGFNVNNVGISQRPDKRLQKLIALLYCISQERQLFVLFKRPPYLSFLGKLHRRKGFVNLFAQLLPAVQNVVKGKS